MSGKRNTAGTILHLGLVLLLATTLFACKKSAKNADPSQKGEGVMTFAEYQAAEVGSEVVIETFVQDKQSWWEDKATLYTQDADGGYFIYKGGCSQEDYDKMEAGHKIKVTGIKSEWHGEIEIINSTIEVQDGVWKAEPEDISAKLNAADLIQDMNKKIVIKDAKVQGPPRYDWDGGGSTGDDLYLDVQTDGGTCTVVFEAYLEGPETKTYQMVETFDGDETVDLEGYLFWYDDPQPHITTVTVK